MGHRRLPPAQDSAIAEDEIRLGHVSGVFGYKGEVRLFLYNPKTELFSGSGATVTLIDVEGARSERQLKSRPGAGKRILGRLSGVIDEAALLRALRDGDIAGAACDVFENEPMVPEELFAMDNVVLTPHVGGGTTEVRQALADTPAANLRAHFAGKPLLTPVP